MSTTAVAAHEETLWGHPKGLYVLFFTEMWERFSYYGMRALLVLYMVASVEEHGLGWGKVAALALFGTYSMSVYVASIPGGLLADHFLGQKKCVMLGGLFLCAGHGVMALPGESAFYAALTLIVIGVGLLKPNISTMVGGLYGEGDSRRDMGFSIFYMGINVGAAVSAITVGYIGQSPDWGWHYGFGLAGIGMALGQLQFMLGQKHLRHVGNFVKSSKEPGQVDKTAPLTKIERDRIFVMLVSFMIVIVFWGAFEQAGGLMSIYTDEKVDRGLMDFEIPASVFQSLNPIFIILLATPVAGYWMKRQRKGKQASAVFKMAIGTMIMGLGFVFMVMAANEGAPQEAIGVRAEEAVMQAGTPNDSSTFWELAQAASNSEGDSAAAVATVIDAETIRIMGHVQGEGQIEEIRSAIHTGLTSVAATKTKQSAASEDSRKSARESIASASYRSAVHASTAMFWLILAYLFHTIGELCSSPVALSFITKLAPIKYASLMMGAYFAATGLGGKLAGKVGEQVGKYNEFTIFSGIMIFTILFSALLLMFLKPLNRKTHGAEEFSDVVDEG